MDNNSKFVELCQKKIKIIKKKLTSFFLFGIVYLRTEVLCFVLYDLDAICLFSSFCFLI